jgi:hypothetical protein
MYALKDITLQADTVPTTGKQLKAARDVYRLQRLLNTIFCNIQVPCKYKNPPHFTQ